MPEYVDELLRVVKGIDLDAIDEATDVLMQAYESRATVFAAGNGGSAATALHFAADLGKFATHPAVGFRAMELGTNVGSLTAWVNDEGWDDVYVRLLAPWISRKDVVVAFSVNGGSGYSPNLVRALELAEETGAWSIGIAGNGGGEFVRLCRTMILIPTPADSEWITPHTESAHVIVHHLICSRLRERIARHA